MTKRHSSICPSHPSVLIRQGFEEMGISKAEFARRLGISRVTMHSLLTGRQGVTAEMAVRLEEAFGGDASMWLGMQADHDLWLARKVRATGQTRKAKRTGVAA